MMKIHIGDIMYWVAIEGTYFDGHIFNTASTTLFNFWQ